tara:strand:- start:19 stop:228 length:210 start_codon:yes stop_codon:yes gene_type:complete
MSFNEAIRLATFIAPGDLDEYDRSTVESLCEDVGYRTTRDFFNAYQRRFHIEMKKQLEYARKWHQGEME